MCSVYSRCCVFIRETTMAFLLFRGREIMNSDLYIQQDRLHLRCSTVESRANECFHCAQRKKAQIILELNTVISPHFTASCGHVYGTVADRTKSKLPL